MNLNDYLTLIAVLLGPILAVRAQGWLDQRRSSEDRKKAIFRTLMSTRLSRISHAHVEALNLIDIEFYGKGSKNRAVRDAWKAYLDHLSNRGRDEEAWANRGLDLFTDLLFALAQALDYEFDKTVLKRSVYGPEAHLILEQQQAAIRQGLVKILKDEAVPISIRVTNADAAERA